MIKLLLYPVYAMQCEVRGRKKLCELILIDVNEYFMSFGLAQISLLHILIGFDDVIFF